LAAHVRLMRRYGNGNPISVYECVCTYKGCGNTLLVTSGQLAAGKQSCGCKMSDDMMRRHLDKYKHL
jgi:hypothetical protein